MAFKHGSKAECWLNGYTISPYLSSVGINATLDTASIDVMGGTFKQSVTGLAGSTLSLQGYFDGGQDQILNSAITSGSAGTKSIFMYTHQGNTAFNTAKCGDGWPSSYEVSTDVGSAGTWSGEVSSEVGFDETILLKPMAAQAAGGNSTQYKMSAINTPRAVAAGEIINAYMIAPGNIAYPGAGTSGTANASLAVKIQTAPDVTGNPGTWVDATGGTFTTISTQNNAQKITLTVGGTINPWVRVLWTGAGTFAVALSVYSL